MKLQKKSQTLNIISAAIIAFFSAQVIHEMVHFLVGLLYGFEVLGFHLFAVNIQFGNPQDRIFEVIMVESSASIINILIALVCMGSFYKLKRAYAKLLAMLMAGFHGMMGFGYLLFDGLLYSPGAVGDWKAVLDLLEGNAVLRIAIILIGAVGYMVLFFWLGKAPLMFLSSKERNDSKARLWLGLKVLILPYVLSLLLNLPLAFWHPLGFPEGFFVIFFQYVFGYSGFITAFFMLWTWLAPRPFLTTEEKTLNESRENLLMIFAGIALVLQFLLAFALHVL